MNTVSVDHAPLRYEDAVSVQADNGINLFVIRVDHMCGIAEGIDVATGGREFERFTLYQLRNVLAAAIAAKKKRRKANG